MAKELGPYKSIRERKDSLYALLVSAGYLKVASRLEEGRCRVAIPNHEIAQVFVSDIKAKINNALQVGTGDIVDALLDRDAEALKVGKYPIFTAASGLDNAESLAGWTLEFQTPIRNPAHLVKDGNSIVLDVQRRGLSIVVR